MRNLFEKYEYSRIVNLKVFDNYEDISKFLDEFDKDAVVKPVGLWEEKELKFRRTSYKDNQKAKAYTKKLWIMQWEVLLK